MQPYQLDSTDWIKQELAGLLGEQVTRDINDIIRLYSLYDGDGQRWQVETKGLDYTPTVKVTNIIAELIGKEARYMMGVEPELHIVPKEKDNQAAQANADVIGSWLTALLEEQKWSKKLLDAAKDCFIGKRVALKLTGKRGGRLGIQFRPSLEFVFDTDPEDVDRLTKVIFFYHTNESTDRLKQRIWRQKYELRDGRCYLTEGLYDGTGRTISETHSDENTGLDFIPVYVIINDGLTGDMTGKSDVERLWDNQDDYNRLKSDDRDALKFNMFPQRVFRDANQETMDRVKIAPGATIDAQTDPSSDHQVDAKILEAQFSYNERIENALNRDKNDMYSLLSVPNVSLEQLKGFAASGKAMKALYWELTTRCEEKWNEWDAALRWMVQALVKMAGAYGTDSLPALDFTVSIDHRYPIADDEDAERTLDLQEVSQQARSRKCYMRKWHPNEDSDSELAQIVSEQKMLGDGFEQRVESELEISNQL